MPQLSLIMGVLVTVLVLPLSASAEWWDGYGGQSGPGPFYSSLIGTGDFHVMCRFELPPIGRRRTMAEELSPDLVPRRLRICDDTYAFGAVRFRGDSVYPDGTDVWLRLEYASRSGTRTDRPDLKPDPPRSSNVRWLEFSATLEISSHFDQLLNRIGPSRSVWTDRGGVLPEDPGALGDPDAQEFLTLFNSASTLDDLQRNESVPQADFRDPRITRWEFVDRIRTPDGLDLRDLSDPEVKRMWRRFEPERVHRVFRDRFRFFSAGGLGSSTFVGDDFETFHTPTWKLTPVAFWWKNIFGGDVVRGLETSNPNYEPTVLQRISLESGFRLLYINVLPEAYELPADAFRGGGEWLPGFYINLFWDLF